MAEMHQQSHQLSPRKQQLIKNTAKWLPKRYHSSERKCGKGGAGVDPVANFNIGTDAKSVNVHLKLVLRTGVKKYYLKQSKRTGVSASFKIGEEAKSAKKKPTKKAVKPKAATPKEA